MLTKWVGIWKPFMLRQGSPERSRRAQHERLPHASTAVFRIKLGRGVAIFAKACFEGFLPNKWQKSRDRLLLDGGPDSSYSSRLRPSKGIAASFRNDFTPIRDALHFPSASYEKMPGYYGYPGL